MKKVIIIIVATVATIAFTASISASNNNPSQGVVSFESSAMPTLNCSMSLQNARNLFVLIPGNIQDICREEYKKVSNKCSRSSSFTHEGVYVRVTHNDGQLATIVFTVPGYKITAQDVSWKELDGMFLGIDR